jgi:hypothetical protein
MAIRHLSQTELAARWNISHRTLERWRWTGEGPQFIKIGGRVVSLAAGRRPTLLVYRAVCADEDTTGWPQEDLGNLRVALNALVRVFRL